MYAIGLLLYEVLYMSITKYNQYVMKKATRALKINKQGKFLDVNNMWEMFSVNLFLTVSSFLFLCFSQFSIKVSEINQMQLKTRPLQLRIVKNIRGLVLYERPF